MRPLTVLSLPSDASAPGATNDLILSSQVLEASCKLWQDWRVVLSVRTADNYLHVFSLKKGTRLGAAPEDVFKVLVPPLDIPVAKGGAFSTKKKGTPVPPKPTRSLVAPDMTFDLGLCTCQLKDLPGEMFDEIIVSSYVRSKTNGALKTWKKPAQRVHLRCLKAAEMAWWTAGPLLVPAAGGDEEGPGGGGDSDEESGPKPGDPI